MNHIEFYSDIFTKFSFFYMVKKKFHIIYTNRYFLSSLQTDDDVQCGVPYKSFPIFT